MVVLVARGVAVEDAGKFFQGGMASGGGGVRVGGEEVEHCFGGLVSSSGVCLVFVWGSEVR